MYYSIKGRDLVGAGRDDVMTFGPTPPGCRASQNGGPVLEKKLESAGAPVNNKNNVSTYSSSSTTLDLHSDQAPLAPDINVSQIPNYTLI